MAHLLLDIEDLKSWLLQLDRIKELTEKAEKIANPRDLIRRDLCRRLLLELRADYHFKKLSPPIQVIYRSFSGKTGFIPFKFQVDLISAMTAQDKQGRFKDVVAQLMMGSGKTAVVAPLVMEILGFLTNQLISYVLPESLLNSVSVALSDSLKCFGRQLHVIRVKREDLTTYRLQRLVALFNEAKEKPMAFISPPSAWQILNLEFDYQAIKLSENLADVMSYKAELATADANRTPLLKAQIETTQPIIEERKTKCKALASILRTSTNSNHALLDEVDLVLDDLLEVNYPDGIKIPIAPQRNHLIFTLFSLIMRLDLKIGNMTLKEALNLDDPEKVKETVAHADFAARYKEVKEVVVKTLCDTFPPFQHLPKDLKPSLHRFLTGKIPPFVQDFVDENRLYFKESELTEKDPKWKEFGTPAKLQADAFFLKHLTLSFDSSALHEKQFAEAVSLTNLLLYLVAPATLTKSANRHYGPVPDDGNGKMCPYGGVRLPIIEREFGFIWEEALYYYQWACLFLLRRRDWPARPPWQLKQPTIT